MVRVQFVKQNNTVNTERKTDWIKVLVLNKPMKESTFSLTYTFVLEQLVLTLYIYVVDNECAMNIDETLWKMKDIPWWSKLIYSSQRK